MIVDKGSGTVKFYNSSKGYGFIAPDDKRKDLFVRQRENNEEIKEGDKVTYDIERGLRGLSAINVKKI